MILAALRRLYEVVETYSKLHLVLEFAAGGELFHKISTLGRLQEAEAKVIFGQVASAVHYLVSDAVLCWPAVLCCTG